MTKKPKAKPDQPPGKPDDKPDKPGKKKPPQVTAPASHEVPADPPGSPVRSPQAEETGSGAT